MRQKPSDDMNTEWKKAFKSEILNRMLHNRNESGYRNRKAKENPSYQYGTNKPYFMMG